jgi:hypothetical protein
MKELLAGRTALRASTRVDSPLLGGKLLERRALAVVLAASALLLAWGNLTRDLNEPEAVLGLAAAEPLGAFGQALGGWIAWLPMARVLPSWITAGLLAPEARGATALVHGPAWIAGIGIVFLATSRVRRALGLPAALMCAIATSCTLALNERPLRLGFDLVLGLCLVAALDRIFSRGSDWVAGFWTAAAVLVGGWPSLLVVLLPTVVLGRSGAYLSWRLLIPPLLAFAAWSAWALATLPPAIWGQALVGPLKQPMSWDVVPWALLLAMPLGPFVVLSAFKSVRQHVTSVGSSSLLGWLQASAILGLAATFLPGLSASIVPIWFGVMVNASAAIMVAARPEVDRRARLVLLAGTFAICLCAGLVGIPYASYLAAALPYFRVELVLVAAGLTLLAAFASVGAWEGRTRWALGCLLGLAFLIKLTHAQIYGPEWNYRLGQGPWGRAVGQWIPPREPLYTIHPWPAEFAFATGHSVRTLVSPQWLDFVKTAGTHYVLLSQSEFDHWPKSAPAIAKIRSFHDNFGSAYILAQTKQKPSAAK